MKKTTTGMAAAIHAQASEAHNSKDATKVQQFFDMCKSLERIEQKAKKFSSIRMEEKAHILLREYYRGEQFKSYSIEREYIGRISQVDFAPDVERAPSITIKHAHKVTRCIDCGRVCASMMEEIESESIAIASIQSITYII